MASAIQTVRGHGYRFVAPVETQGAVVDVASPELPTPRHESSFVGRCDEMRRLGAALEDAMLGYGRVVLLAGEAGIGKTRTVEELLERAEALGAKVLAGRCLETMGAPAFWPWTRALRPYVSEAAAERLRAEMGAGAGDIA